MSQNLLFNLDNLGELSRIAVSSQEKETIKTQLESILGYVKILQEVKIEEDGMSHREALTKETLREDEIKPCDAMSRTWLFENMPRKSGDLLEVPEVFENV